MTEQTTPLGAIHDQFAQARGDDADGTWSWGVTWRLLRRDVEPSLVHEGLQEALALVRQTQESPVGLYGTPDEHADALYECWAQEGRLHLSDASRTTWGQVPSSGLAWSSFFSLAFFALLLVRGEPALDWTAGMIVIPLGLGAAQAVVAATWHAQLARRGPVVAAAVSAAALVLLAAVVATVNELAQRHPFGTATVWWYVPLAGACAVLATGWRRWCEARPARTETVLADPDDWSRELAAILRTRYAMPDARVHRVVGDAHALAADAGRAVEEEFGTPEAYAATFLPDLAERQRRSAILHAALAVMWLLPALWGAVWGPVLAAGWALLAWQAHRRYLDLRGQSGR